MPRKTRRGPAPAGHRDLPRADRRPDRVPPPDPPVALRHPRRGGPGQRRPAGRPHRPGGRLGQPPPQAAARAGVHRARARAGPRHPRELVADPVARHLVERGRLRGRHHGPPGGRSRPRPRTSGSRSAPSSSGWPSSAEAPEEWRQAAGSLDTLTSATAEQLARPPAAAHRGGRRVDRRGDRGPARPGRTPYAAPCGPWSAASRARPCARERPLHPAARRRAPTGAPGPDGASPGWSRSPSRGSATRCGPSPWPGRRRTPCRPPWPVP